MQALAVLIVLSPLTACEIVGSMSRAGSRPIRRSLQLAGRVASVLYFASLSLCSCFCCLCFSYWRWWWCSSMARLFIVHRWLGQAPWLSVCTLHVTTAAFPNQSKHLHLSLSWFPNLGGWQLRMDKKYMRGTREFAEFGVSGRMSLEIIDSHLRGTACA